MCSNTLKMFSNTKKLHNFINYVYLLYMKKNYTIKDIAELANVSKGTVDRVLHKRGKVSQKALDSVNAILSEIDYQPNLIARNLKNNKAYRVCILLPNPKSDAYWIPCMDGINDAKNEFKSFNVIVETYFFEPNSTSSFFETNEILLESNPDAVLLVPLFYKETLEVIDNYNSLGIISGTFNNQIKSKRINSFVGQNLFQSGRVAARLLDLLINEGLIAIIHIDEEYENALHMQEKEQGFRNYFKDNNHKKIHLKTLNLKYPNLKQALIDFLNNNSNLKGIFITTSKSYQIAAILSEMKNKKISIVGYDLLKQNIEFLNNKLIDFLIHQNPKRQAFIGTSALIEHLIFDKKIEKEVLLPIEIINSENARDYIL